MSDFGRRTWDKEEYAQLAKEDKLNFEQSLKCSSTDAELQQLKIKYTNHHALIKDSMSDLNNKVLATGLSSYKKGKQYGFYCDLCNLTFKDTLQYIDHLNHKIHQIKFEAIFDEPLILNSRDNDDVLIDEFKKVYENSIKQFIKENHTERSGIRKPRKKIKTEQPSTKKDIIDNTDNDNMKQLMGFASFGTSKK